MDVRNHAGKSPFGDVWLQQVFPGGEEPTLVLVDKLGNPEVVAALGARYGVIGVELAELDSHVGFENQSLWRQGVVEVGAVGDHCLRVGLADLPGDVVDKVPDVVTGVAGRADPGAVQPPAIRTTTHIRIVVGHHRKELPHRAPVRAWEWLGTPGKIIPCDGDHLFSEPPGRQAGLNVGLKVQLFHPAQALGTEPLGMRGSKGLVVIRE